MNNSFEYDLQVNASHLDTLAHVNNVQYLQWVQDVAGAHWNILTQNTTFDFGIWVVRRHTITYKRPAKLNDWLTIKTYVTKTEGVLSERRVQIYFKGTSILVAQCETIWCYLDSKTLKPLAVPEEVICLLG